MYLTSLTKEQCEQVRIWRNDDISMLRTPFFLTKEMQETFYNNVICNRNSEHRYYAIVTDDRKDFIGMGGLTNISLENRSAEISLIINPEYRLKGYGIKSVILLLEEGFKRINLDNIYGECYTCSQALRFWEKVILRLDAFKTVLPKRKYYDGKYFNALYFNFEKDVIK